jgi:hypothetical protein
MKDIIISQLKSCNGLLTAASICFILVTTTFYTILIPFMELLVQFRYDQKLSTMTVVDYMNTLPQMGIDLYNFLGLLLIAFAIWIAINILHHFAAFIYSAYISTQREKYPMSY